MSKLIKIAILTILLLPGLTFAREHHANNRHKNWSNRADSHSRIQYGWNINPRKAHRASQCYYYSLYVDGGKGSARIMSLPGKNYIQVNNGYKSGYVCFDGPTTLELGKLSDPNVYVELEIEDIGTFYFDSGDRGAKLANSWHRSYWNL